MNRVNITYYIYRSNPLSERTISVPEHFLIRDLLASFYLAMGIPMACGEICELIPIAPSKVDGRKGVEEELRLDMELSIRAWIDTWRESSAGTSQEPIHGKAYIYADEKSRSLGELTFFFQVEEIDTKSSSVAEMDDAIPVVLQACGWHLPSGVFRIGQVNEIWQSFDENESVQMDGVTYIASRMTYDEKKTRGLICSHFAPELALMLHTELAVPRRVILECYKVNELEDMCRVHRAYYHSKKKAVLLNALMARLPDVIDSKGIFEEMDYPEYMIFRSILLNGMPDRSILPELKSVLPTLFRYGMVAWPKKVGILFLEELVSYYEEWFDTEREKRYRTDKLLTYVLNGCGYYYGIFSKEMGWRMLIHLFPDVVTREDYDGFWDTKGKYRRDLKIKICDIYSETPGWAYDYDLWYEMKKPMLYYCALVQDESPRYIPDRDEFADMCFYRQNCPGTEIADFINKLYYYDAGYLSYDDMIGICLNSIRMGLSDREVAQNVANKTVRYFYRGDYMVDQLVPFIEGIRPHVPQVLLYGYMEKQMESCQVPDTARKRFEAIVIEAEEAEARRKKEEEERKRQAKKQTAKKRRRY